MTIRSNVRPPDAEGLDVVVESVARHRDHADRMRRTEPLDEVGHRFKAGDVVAVVHDDPAALKSEQIEAPGRLVEARW